MRTVAKSVFKVHLKVFVGNWSPMAAIVDAPQDAFCFVILKLYNYIVVYLRCQCFFKI